MFHFILCIARIQIPGVIFLVKRKENKIKNDNIMEEGTSAFAGFYAGLIFWIGIWSVGLAESGKPEINLRRKARTTTNSHVVQLRILWTTSEVTTRMYLASETVARHSPIVANVMAWNLLTEFFFSAFRGKLAVKYVFRWGAILLPCCVYVESFL